jgi:hypothetical protein
MNSIINLSAKQLRKAANLKDKIESLQNDLSRLLGKPEAVEKKSTRRKRKPMSAAAKAKIAAAARARWKRAKAAGKTRL